MGAGDPEALQPAPLLDRIAAELLQCRAILSRIEHSGHDILDTGPATATSRSWQKNMQDMDLLGQNLSDLACCLHAAAAEPAVRKACDLSAPRVLGHLRLDDLRQRLRGKAAAPGQAASVEFF